MALDTMKKNWLRTIGILLLCALAQLSGPVATAVPPEQASEVNVLIVNELDSEICVLLISASSSAEWGDNRLGAGSILPGATYSLTLAPGTYDALVAACDDRVLLERQALEVDTGYELHVTQLDARKAECATFQRQGGQLTRQSQYPGAINALQSALACYLEVGNRSGEAAALASIGLVYSDQGRYADALEQMAAALEIAKATNSRALEGSIYHNMAGAYREQGQYSTALQYYRWSLIIDRADGDVAGEGTNLNSIGLLYENQGQYAKALEYYEQALAIRQETGNRVGEAVTLHNIGAVQNYLGHFEEALETFRRTLAIARDEGDRRGEGETLHLIGQAYINLRQYDEALATFQQALEIARELGDRPNESYVLHRMGLVHFNRQQYDDALQAFDQALTIAREIGDRPVEGDILDFIGAVYAAEKRYGEALAHYQQAIEIYESVRATAGDEAARASFIGQRAAAYDRMIRLQLQQGQAEDAFLMSERGRARAFLDSLATGQVELADDAAADLLARENEAYAARQAAENALARARDQDQPDVQLVADLEHQLTAAENAHDAALAAIQSRQDQLSTLVPGRTNSVLTLSAVQELLDDQTTLVSYWVFGDRTVAFVITAKGFRVVELPDATRRNIEGALDGLYQWINKENPHPRPLRNLYSWLVAPLVDELRTPHVAFVPHQALHSVPFAALSDGKGYLGQHHLISVLPSASALEFLDENARRAARSEHSGAVVFGSPATDLPALPYAEAEVVAVSGLLETEVYTGAQASELRLRTVVGGTNILHLAAHGMYNAGDPLSSAIALAAEGSEDGLLETREIFGLPLAGNDLVVLSACETNVGQLSRGDEVVGLTRAFLFAGSPTIISSLWNVNDAATETLMSSFYRHWLEDGMSKLEALQAAQSDVRMEPRWASPYYWSAFVLNGHPGVR